MGKNKGRSKVQDDELIGDDDVKFDEVKGGEGGSSSKGQSFLEKNRNMLLIGLVAVAAIGGYFFYQNSQKGKLSAEAQSDLVMPVLNYEQDSITKAMSGFEAVAEDYSGTETGNLARYYLGTSYLKANNLEEGIATLEEYKKGKSMVSAAAYGALGYAYEQKSEFDEAAKNYRSAAKTPSENKFSTPFYLMHAARNYRSAGNNDEALSIYKEIKEKYPLSQEVRDGAVDRYLWMLSEDDL